MNATIKRKVWITINFQTGAAVRGRLSAGAAAAAPQAVSRERHLRALPGTEGNLRPSSPSSGKAPLPPKAALWLGRGPAAPHGTWESRSAGRGKSDRESHRRRRAPHARPPSAPRPGPIRSLAQVWAVLPLGQAEVWPALAKQAGSKPRWQVFPILLQDTGSKEAPNRDGLGRRTHHFVIQPPHLNPQSRFSLRDTAS